MAVIVDEPTPLARSTAAQIIGTLTSMGLVGGREVGVLWQNYISAFYGNSVSKVGETANIPTSNVMAVLDYNGRIAPCFSWVAVDPASGSFAPAAGSCDHRIAVDLYIKPQTGLADTYTQGIIAGFYNPFTTGLNNAYGGPGGVGAQFEVFGQKAYTITKADLVAGQLPYFDFRLKFYFAWINAPGPNHYVQFQFTPSYTDNTIVLPPPYYQAFNIPRGKPTTTRSFALNGLARLDTPYNQLPNPYAAVSGTGQPYGYNGNKASLQSFYRQFASVANGGPSYVYNPADGLFPAAAKLFEFNGRFQVYPPLYYVYGTDPASVITWSYPSYSANPLDSRP